MPGETLMFTRDALIRIFDLPTFFSQRITTPTVFFSRTPLTALFGRSVLPRSGRALQVITVYVCMYLSEATAGSPGYKLRSWMRVNATRRWLVRQLSFG